LFDASAPLQEQLAQLHRRLGSLEDREAIRQLHIAFGALVESQAYDAVPELFAEDATVDLNGETFSGRATGVARLFRQQYAEQQAAAIHSAYRQDPCQRQDEIRISPDRQRASATFHACVRVSRPIRDDSVVGTMARLQGMSASSAWENGRFDVEYAREGSRWLIQRLRYQVV
jgi:hypothetical protein